MLLLVTAVELKLEEDVSRYYTLLRDPARRKIIEVLGEQGKIGFKELKSILGLGVGTVYYHLDMLSAFITQDRKRKYMLNDNGRLLYRFLKEGGTLPTLEIKKAFSHRFGRWLFLSMVFSKTAQPVKLFPVSILVLVAGALGSAFAGLDSMLFFYFPFSSYDFEALVALFFSNWVGLFLFSDAFVAMLYKRTGGDFQLFTCLGISAFPMSLFPYLYMFLPCNISRYLLFALQIWSMLLMSSAFCFAKGLRLDKSIIVSLTVLYLNVMILLLIGRL